jgi:hypothetical protein
MIQNQITGKDGNQFANILVRMGMRWEKVKRNLGTRTKIAPDP